MFRDRKKKGQLYAESENLIFSAQGEKGPSQDPGGGVLLTAKGGFGCATADKLAPGVGSFPRYGRRRRSREY